MLLSVWGGPGYAARQSSCVHKHCTLVFSVVTLRTLPACLGWIASKSGKKAARCPGHRDPAACVKARKAVPAAQSAHGAFQEVGLAVLFLFFRFHQCVALTHTRRPDVVVGGAARSRRMGWRHRKLAPEAQTAFVGVLCSAGSDGDAAAEGDGPRRAELPRVTGVRYYAQQQQQERRGATLPWVRTRGPNHAIPPPPSPPPCEMASGTHNSSCSWAQVGRRRLAGSCSAPVENP